MTADMFPVSIPVTPARKLTGRVARLRLAQPGGFITEAVASLAMTFEGIAGDHHAGLTRKAGGREPWHQRGLEMRNERQVSLVCPDECAAVAAAMGLAELKPEWMGANIVVSGIPRFSMLPPRTLLFFEGGATLKIDGQNAPCRQAGRAIAEGAGAADAEGVALAFKDAAKRSRGLVAWVEVPGVIQAGATVTARLPEQWIYS
jgi:MOSC domain-containing protein YiiM